MDGLTGVKQPSEVPKEGAGRGNAALPKMTKKTIIELYQDRMQLPWHRGAARGAPAVHSAPLQRGSGHAGGPYAAAAEGAGDEPEAVPAARRHEAWRREACQDGIVKGFLIEQCQSDQYILRIC